MSETSRSAHYREYMRYFNTSGPCVPGLHYMLPPEPRLPDALELIRESRYFVVHAPRQTGKTTTLAALAKDLNEGGQHAAVLFSCERAREIRDDVGAAEDLILHEIAAAAATQEFAAEMSPPSPWPDAPTGARMRRGLTAWAERSPLPLVLFFDDIDALCGNSLISVLAQLRAGHNARPSPFPASVVLCGLRSMRPDTADFFNVSAALMRIGDFTRDQVAELYAQHTADTGQEFTPSAVDRAFEYSQGQPRLVNTLGSEIVGAIAAEPPGPITAVHVDQAKERLVQSRTAHLDQLAARIEEPSVQRVLELLLVGSFPLNSGLGYANDVSYICDLDLIAERPSIRIANSIYKELIAREMTADRIAESFQERAAFSARLAATNTLQVARSDGGGTR